VALATPAKRVRRRGAPPPACPVERYARSVLDGRVVTGEVVRMACQRHVDDLARSLEPGAFIRWNQDEAERVIRICAQFRQSKGRFAGQPLVLEPWQEFVVGSVFGWEIWDEERDAWVRRYRTAHVEIARKNGKSTLAAAIALILLDFVNEGGAEVYAAATKRDQARIVWSEASRMVRQTPFLRRRIKVVPSTGRMYVRGTDGTFSALGADSDTEYGLNPSGVIIDELHIHRTRELVDALETATGARSEPLIWYITTAGLDRASIYLEQRQYAERVVRGAVPDERTFVYIACLDKGDDWTDPASYIKANPNLGVSIQLSELIEERDKALEKPSAQNTFKRMRLNVITGQNERAIDLRAWDEGGDVAELEDLAGLECFGGLDLASTRDLTAFLLLFPDESGDYDVHAWFWVPEAMVNERSGQLGSPYDVWVREGFIEQTEGDITDYDRIEVRVAELIDEHKFRIREVAYDRWNAGQLVTHLGEDGLEMVPFGQGYASMSAPTKELVERLVPGKLLHHGGNPVLRWMADNLSVRMDPAANMKPDREKSADKIDGMVALIMALGRALVAEPQDETSVYEAEGLRYV
jgi:phage terminase large subunit-like protein